LFGDLSCVELHVRFSNRVSDAEGIEKDSKNI